MLKYNFTEFNNEVISNYDIVARINFVISFLPLVNIVLGLVGNTACFFIFRFNKDLKKMSSMVFLSFSVCMDTLSLFVWNLDYFTLEHFDFYIEYLTIFTCRFFTFIQYLSLHSSSFLLCMVSVDRFFTVNKSPGLSLLPFGTTKSATIWSTFIVIFFALLNSHMAILNGYLDPPEIQNNTVLNFQNGSYINTTNLVYIYSSDTHCYYYSPNLPTSQFWGVTNLVLYNLIPFCIMLLFNSLLIVTILSSRKSLNSSNNKESVKSIRKKNRITLSILTITFVFIILTAPSSIAWAFLKDQIFALSFGSTIFQLCGFFSFFNHSSIFLTCFVSNYKFRSVVINGLKGLFMFRKSAKINQTDTRTVNSLY